jgi:chromosome partitioning protein
MMHLVFATIMDGTWTFKEVAGAIGSTLLFTATATYSLVMWLRPNTSDAAYGALTADKDRLQKDVAAAQAKIETLNTEVHTVRQGKLKAENDALRSKVIAKKALAEVDRQTQISGQVSEEAEKLKGELADTSENLDSVQRLIHRTTKKGGDSWNERVPASAPEFKGLESRQTSVVSVLNLKGGVGKTTVVANLGAAFDEIGYRTLLVDLDLQGSLTGLFLPEDKQRYLQDQGKLIEDFLNSSFDAEYPNILDYTQSILGKSALVPTSDTLAYAETNLTLRWLLKTSNRDPRFLLRRELQLKRVTNAFNIVLLDCPPILNVCCVNAMAASDYLLIPIVPSKQATARVPVLLNRLHELRENINPDLQVIGVVTNRTARSELTVEETNRLDLLKKQCHDVWKAEVPLLDTFIRQGGEIRAAEDEHRTLRKTDSMFQHFTELACELQARLPSYCRAGAEKAEKELAS